MSEIKLNAGNWLGSEDGKVTKTVTLTSESAETVSEGESLIIKAGTLIQDSSMGYGLLLRDVDVTDGPRVAQLMIRGKYIGSKLPYELSGEEKTALAQIGMFDVESTESPAGGNVLKIVNNGLDDVEIYYEEDKEEYGNTTIMGGATVTITLEHFSWDTPYFIRYASGGSLNSHVFNGVYQGVTETNLEVGYYDGNILPPHESKTDTRWVFESGDGGTLTITASSKPGTDETLEIVNESSEDVEIYYEDEKAEYGNTTVTAGSTKTISIDSQYPYYIRYSGDGSDNRHNFNGTYKGVSGYETEVFYYDGNICPPNEVSHTEWSFQSGDGGTLLIRDAK